ncbi:MAG: glycosyltransferase family 2 protein [Acidobacteria bacterium]|nr:glycosyltransferase family 2 protein [Acidobacteriota bacterium]
MSESSPWPVSVIIPVYNGERYLREAITSVLGQTCPPAEVLAVLDPRTTDGSASVMGEFSPRVRCLTQRGSGLGAARNQGIRAARYGWLAFLDADDRWTHRKLELQTAAMRQEPSLELIFGQVRQFISPELSPDEVPAPAATGGRLPGICAGTMLIRRAVFEAEGYFNDTWRMGEFMEWYARVRDAGRRQAVLPDVVLERRIHRHNMGIRERDHQREYLQALKSILDRRRKSE